MVARSHRGLVRLHNEDCVECDQSNRFALLADGMGGLMAGDIASRIAVEAAGEALRNPQDSIVGLDLVENALSAAHLAVSDRAKSMRYTGKMGTTLVLWARIDTQDFVGHVGDSRLYTYDQRGLVQRTLDHTVAQRLVEKGQIDKNDTSFAANSHVLTQAVGIPGLFRADVAQLETSARVLLCSDGLSDLVGAEELARIMATPDLNQCADQLIKSALDKGGRDNVSLVLIEA